MEFAESSHLPSAGKGEGEGETREENKEYETKGNEAESKFADEIAKIKSTNNESSRPTQRASAVFQTLNENTAFPKSEESPESTELNENTEFQKLKEKISYFQNMIEKLKAKSGELRQKVDERVKLHEDNIFLLESVKHDILLKHNKSPDFQMSDEILNVLQTIEEMNKKRQISIHNDILLMLENYNDANSYVSYQQLQNNENETQEKIMKLKNDNKDLSNEKQQLRSKLNEEIQNIEQKYENEMMKLKEKNDEIVNNLKTEHQKELSKIEKEIENIKVQQANANANANANGIRQQNQQAELVNMPNVIIVALILVIVRILFFP